MRKKIVLVSIVLGMLFTVCGCQNGEEQQTETEQNVSETTEASSTVTEETTENDVEENASEDENALEKAEESVQDIQVLLEGVTIDKPDNWEILSYDEEAGTVTYGIEQDGMLNEVTLYTLEDIALNGKQVTHSVIGKTFNTLAEKFHCHDYSMVVLGSEPKGYVMTVFYLENRTRQISCLVGDDRTLVMESDVSTVTDEVASHVAFSYDSEDASKTVSFPTTELCKECEVEGAPNYYDDEETEQLLASKDTGGTVEQKNTVEEKKTEQTQPKEEVVADTSEYVYFSDTSGPLDMTNTTIVRDGNPNYVITRNGPGPIVKSSYPYIGVPYYGMDGQGDFHILLIKSTDYYGCPYEFEYDGTSYTYTNRVYNRTEPENDVSSWLCDCGDMSKSMMVTICVKLKYIDFNGPLGYMSFMPRECFADPSLVPD